MYMYFLIFTDMCKNLSLFLKRETKKTLFLVTHIVNHFFHLAFHGHPSRSLGDKEGMIMPM